MIWWSERYNEILDRANIIHDAFGVLLAFFLPIKMGSHRSNRRITFFSFPRDISVKRVRIKIRDKVWDRGIIWNWYHIMCEICYDFLNFNSNYFKFFKTHQGGNLKELNLNFFSKLNFSDCFLSVFFNYTLLSFIILSFFVHILWNLHIEEIWFFNCKTRNSL